MMGTGPQALQQYIYDNYQQTRSGRPDVPPLVTDSNGNPSTDPDDISQPGEVMVLKNRERVETNRAVTDTIWLYHPSENPIDIVDQGYDEVRWSENVQLDIDLTDRTDPDTGQRTLARERMVGDRDDADWSGVDPPYHGLLGEVVYVLETARRGFDEYERVSHTLLGGTLENSDATFRIDVTLEVLAKPTVS